MIVSAAFTLYHGNAAGLRQYLASLIDNEFKKREPMFSSFEIESIVKYVCDQCGALPTGIKTSTRIQEYVEARAICYHILKFRFGWSLKRIGMLFGNRDHSSIGHGLQNYTNWYERDRNFRQRADKSLEFTRLILTGDDNS